MSLKPGKLFIVALPIGNIEDITLRALKVLKSVQLVAAEDTRVFKELCNRLDLSPPKIVSYHEHNQKDSALGLIELLKNGKDLALTTDAGTPGISDPGYSIVASALKNGFTVVPIPGASALTAALSVSPIGGPSSFHFGGFPPNKSNDRKRYFTELKTKSPRLVFFEAPHRIIEHLEDAKDILAPIEVAIFRELTKDYEEILWGTIDECINRFKGGSPKGEFVVIYKIDVSSRLTEVELKEEINSMTAQGLSTQEILENLKDKSPLPRKQLYQLILDSKTL